ncbi:hypothetical protein Agabi119p4_3289 [Agaricus bisporus var. burnettii]|uniref:Uncharacterized protein n=1 Tax=Agaricus bisporus var. burnettii TaxID=192524 RepID=A0A8H7KJ54_AGABI|nr:hypothetical protein Agabi119p4_3289 [Agaricus bisporus var. burnettii]
MSIQLLKEASCPSTRVNIPPRIQPFLRVHFEYLRYSFLCDETNDSLLFLWYSCGKSQGQANRRRIAFSIATGGTLTADQFDSRSTWRRCPLHVLVGDELVQKQVSLPITLHSKFSFHDYAAAASFIPPHQLRLRSFLFHDQLEFTRDGHKWLLDLRSGIVQAGTDGYNQ